jgi:serine O-acetyltransferase
LSRTRQLVLSRGRPVIGRFARAALALYGIEIPTSVVIGDDFAIAHRGYGIVVHPQCRIGDRVIIFQGVTIGRADAHTRGHMPSPFERVEIGDDVVLAPGAKVMGGPGVTRVGNGTVIGANAVLTRSTGEWEIWGGVPARKLADREPPPPLREHYLRSPAAHREVSP